VSFYCVKRYFVQCYICYVASLIIYHLPTHTIFLCFCPPVLILEVLGYTFVSGLYIVSLLYTHSFLYCKIPGGLVIPGYRPTGPSLYFWCKPSCFCPRGWYFEGYWRPADKNTYQISITHPWADWSLLTARGELFLTANLQGFSSLARFYSIEEYANLVSLFCGVTLIIRHPVSFRRVLKSRSKWNRSAFSATTLHVLCVRRMFFVYR